MRTSQQPSAISGGARLRRALIVLCLLHSALAIPHSAFGTQPPLGNVVEMAWQPIDPTNIYDYTIWITTNGGTKWTVVDSTRRTDYAHTNRSAINPTNVYYAVTAMPWKPFGIRRESELCVLHWAPTRPPTNALATAKLKAVEVPGGQTIRVSSDGRTFEDWLNLRVVTTNGLELTNALIRVEPRTSTARSNFFFAYPALPPPAVPPAFPK